MRGHEGRREHRERTQASRHGQWAREDTGEDPIQGSRHNFMMKRIGRTPWIPRPHATQNNGTMSSIEARRGGANITNFTHKLGYP